MNILKLIAARYFLFAYGAIALLMISPLVIVAFAHGLASLSHCPSGVQYSNAVCTNGDIIYGLSQAGWLLVITVPIGFLALGAVIFVNILLYLLLQKRTAIALFFFERLRKKFRK